MTARRIIQIADLDKQAEASGCPDLWADICSVAHDIARLERDIARVRWDIDHCPDTPCGRAFARRWYASNQRREDELYRAKGHLDRLRRDAGPMLVNDAASSAPAIHGAWLQVPSGSDGDG